MPWRQRAYPPPISMPPAPILTPIVEGPPPPVEVKRRGQRICTACGKSLRKAAFSQKQWRSPKGVSRRCNACILAGRDASAAVKAALLKAAYPAADFG